jgi:3-oxoacyl-[acyl-carrier protein] reductase
VRSDSGSVDLVRFQIRLGAATCRLLAANGARLVVHGRDEDKIGAVVDDIASDGGRAIGIAADVTDFAAIERMRLRVEEELSPVEVLIAFAAGGGPLPGPTVEITEEEWRSAIDGNLTSAFLTLKSFLPGMVERGSGSIVTMASISASRVQASALRGNALSFEKTCSMGLKSGESRAARTPARNLAPQ